MRIAIADDEGMDRQHLMSLLERYCGARGLAAEFACFPSAETLLDAFEPGAFQLVFLDIYMGQLNGMDAARAIHRDDPDCQIIFFTTSQTHAVASYEVRAAWYLVKPVEYHRLETAMDTVCAQLLRDHRQISVHSTGVEVRVPLREVLFLDCADERTRLHLRDRVIVVDERARDLMAGLTRDPRFLTCNRNIVVNLDWIDRALEGDFLLKTGQTVPIRQRGRAAIKKDYLTWSLRGLRKGADL